MSAWLFDLGNSRLKCAPLAEPAAMRSVAHDGKTFAADWEAALPARCDVACVASVAAPQLTARLFDALAARCPRIVRARTLPALAGVRIAYAQPRRLGVDRFLALLGAHARAAEPALVVGVGTALTIDLLDATGLHRGGRIAPSPALMRASLHARAAQLSAQGGAYAEFAADTDDALVSGCEGAALALVERSLAAAAAQLGAPPRLLLHGGGAVALAPRLPAAVEAPALVLEGLARWARVLGAAA
ncbi:MAG TPA: type III pantothenate kinase [Xanthomonadaceae bacterium]|nr:type III pantothenate kinase [Xanthomonadaceae bacterium]